jgi:CTP:molybdopterin cytidylyltransferase MocA
LTVAAAVLAAGRGSRVRGRTPKPLLEAHGQTLLSGALDAALASGLRPVVLVVGYRGRAVAKVVPEAVEVVLNRGWRLGIAHSLHAALGVLEHRTEIGAVCVGLADQPRVGAEAYRRLAAAHAEGAALVVATYSGNRGNPVLIGRALWPEARGLRGDVGARALMSRHSVVEVDCTGTGNPRDVDTLDDLRALDETGEE